MPLNNKRLSKVESDSPLGGMNVFFVFFCFEGLLRLCAQWSRNWMDMLGGSWRGGGSGFESTGGGRRRHSHATDSHRAQPGRTRLHSASRLTLKLLALRATNRRKAADLVFWQRIVLWSMLTFFLLSLLCQSRISDIQVPTLVLEVNYHGHGCLGRRTKRNFGGPKGFWRIQQINTFSLLAPHSRM